MPSVFVFSLSLRSYWRPGRSCRPLAQISRGRKLSATESMRRERQKLAFVLGSELLGSQVQYLDVRGANAQPSHLREGGPSCLCKGLRASHAKCSATSTDPALFPPTECGTVKLVTGSSCSISFIERPIRCVSFNVAVACSVLLAAWT